MGGVQGARKGLSPDAVVDPSSTAVGQVTLNTIQNTIISAVTGMAVGGPVGAAVNVATDAVGSGAGVYMFVKNGSAKVVGQELASAIDAKVKPGEGAFKGMFKGAIAGGKSGVKSAAKTGFREGKGTTAGIIDGLRETNKEFARAKAPKRNVVLAALGTALGVTRAALSAPTGVVLSLFYKPTEPNRELEPATRLAVAGATGAATGAALGMPAGPVGMIVGAGIGLVANLLGPGSKDGLRHRVHRSMRRVQRGNDDMGTDVANNNRNMFQGFIVGGLAGARHGWDSVVDFSGS